MSLLGVSLCFTPERFTFGLSHSRHQPLPLSLPHLLGIQSAYHLQKEIQVGEEGESQALVQEHGQHLGALCHASEA